MVSFTGFCKLDKAINLVNETFKEYILLKSQIEYLKTLLVKTPNSDFDAYRRYQKEIINDILERSALLMLSGTEILSQLTYEDSLDNTQITHVIRRANNAVNAWFQFKEEKYTEAMFTIAPEIIEALKIRKDSIERIKNLFFIAGEASVAQSPEEIKKIIAKYTLPVASYKIKRITTSTLMLNAYAGIGGLVYLKDNTYAPTILAPIGIEWTFSTNNILKQNTSIGLMASLIDLGNIIDYRINSSTTDNSVVNFKNVFSPGLIINFGISKKFPLSLNTGYLMNPQRIILTLTADLPLVAFWKSKSTIKPHEKSLISKGENRAFEKKPKKKDSKK